MFAAVISFVDLLCFDSTDMRIIQRICFIIVALYGVCFILFLRVHSKAAGMCDAAVLDRF